MAIHDAWPRLTPYELLLPEPDFAARRFPAIGDEAEVQGQDAGNPAVFVMLGAVQGVLAELRDDDGDSGSAHDHGVALFFAWQLWRAGPSVALARATLLRELLADGADASLAEGGDWAAALGSGVVMSGASYGPGSGASRSAALGTPAGYIQLPQHLVWLEEGDAGGRGHGGGQSPQSPHPAEPAGYAATPAAQAAPPESVDGFFWFGDRTGALHLALVAGMRGDRPGFALVPLPPQPLGTLPEWAAGPARQGGRDFSCSLPGAEIEGLFAVRTPAEAYKLAALLLHRLVRLGPDALRPAAARVPPQAAAAASASPSHQPLTQEPSSGPAASPPHPTSPRPSALPFVILA